MTPGEVVAAIIGIAAAFGTQKFLPDLISWLTGKAHRERSRVRELMDERDAAEQLGDEEATYRRKVEEFASYAIRVAVEHGVPRDLLGQWPSRASLDAVRDKARQILQRTERDERGRR